MTKKHKKSKAAAADDDDTRQPKVKKEVQDKFDKHHSAVVKKTGAVSHIPLQGLITSAFDGAAYMRSKGISTKLTTEDLNAIRLVLLTLDRSKMIEIMQKVTFGNKDGQTVMVYKNPLSEIIVSGYPVVSYMYRKAKTYAQHFVWIHRHP